MKRVSFGVFAAVLISAVVGAPQLAPHKVLHERQSDDRVKPDITAPAGITIER